MHRNQGILKAFCRKRCRAGAAAAGHGTTGAGGALIVHCVPCRRRGFPPERPQRPLMSVIPVSCHLSGLCKCAAPKGSAEWPGKLRALTVRMRGERRCREAERGSEPSHCSSSSLTPRLTLPLGSAWFGKGSVRAPRSPEMSACSPAFSQEEELWVKLGLEPHGGNL